MKFKNYLIIFFVLLLGFLNLFASSGLADNLNYTSTMTFFSFPLFMWIAKKPQKYIFFNSTEKGFYKVFFVIMLFAILISYNDKAFQLTNLVVTFGLPLWCRIFTRLPWERLDFYKLGIYSGVLGLALISLFMPGRWLSGWNSNSPIFAMPLVLFSLSCIWCSDAKFMKRAVTIAVIWVLTILFLEIMMNRGSILALILFAVFLFAQSRLSPRRLRIIAISIIALNVIIPYFYDSIEKMSLFEFMEDSAASLIEERKEGGFNGREYFWYETVRRINENPVIGTVGVRSLYPHNFSMDLLICFGWFGWIAFVWMTLVVLFRTIREKSVYNVFPMAFLCFVFLNTFENVFACCNMFVIFSCIIPAVALRMNKKSKLAL